MAKSQNTKIKRVCQVPGCNSHQYRKGYCNRHYLQIWRHGKILKQTKYDSNKIIQLKNACLIILYSKDFSKISVAIIDKEDLYKIKKHKWSAVKDGNVLYAQMHTKNKKGKLITLRMHRLIMNAKKGCRVDHRSRNGLDNRKENLRFCTQQQNCWNSIGRKGCTSSYKGVHWSKIDKKWYVHFRVNNKVRNFGSFNSEINAAKKANEVMKKYHGEFARLNTI